MRPARPLVVLFVAGLVMGGLAGCSGPGETAAPDPEDSPLNKYLSAIWGTDLSEEEQIERFEKENAAREELVAECMADEGFEYIPNTQNGSISFSSDTEWKPDDREWVAQYGYGMVNFPGRDEPFVGDEMYEDPNQDYVMSLSESEQQAYYEVLYGPPMPEDQLNEDGSYEYDWEQSGCFGWAQHELGQEDPMQSDAHKPLMDALSEFWTEMATAPGFDELNAAWASCMADAGFPDYKTQQDAQFDVSEQLNAYYEGQTEWIENDPALAELGEKEIEIALADLDCREETDYRTAYAEVQYKLEEDFIADHKAELDALKADAEQGS